MSFAQIIVSRPATQRLRDKRRGSLSLYAILNEGEESYHSMSL